MPTTIFPGSDVGGTYLNNRIVGPESVSSTLANDDGIRRMADDAAKDVFNAAYDERSGENLASRLSQYSIAGVVDTVDAVGSVLPYIERGDTWGALGKSEISGLEGLNDFRARNQGGVELTSAILTGIAGNVFAETVIMGAVGKSLLSSTSLMSSRLVKTGSDMMVNANRAARLAEINAARAGLSVGMVSPGSRALMYATATKNVGRAAISEATIAFFGQNNDGMWAESNAENAFYVGLGLAIPGVAGAIQGRAAARVMANEPRIMAIRAKAMDPNEFVSIRDKIADPNVAFNPKMEMRPSERVVQAAFEAHQEIATGSAATPQLLGQRLQQEKFLQDETQKFAAKGIPSIPSARSVSFSSVGDDLGRRAHIMAAQKEDPSLFMEAVGVGVGDLAGAQQSKALREKQLLASKKPADQALGLESRKEQIYALVNNRLYPNNEFTRAIVNFEPKKIEWKPTTKIPGLYDYEVSLGARKYRIDASLNAVKDFGKKQAGDQLLIVEGLRKLSAAMRGPVKSRPTFVLKDGDDWMKYEFAQYHSKSKGLVDLSKSSAKTPQELAFVGLKAKIKAMKADGVYGADLVQEVRLRYNLPAASNLERIHDGSSRILKSVLDAVDQGKVKSIDEVKELYAAGLKRHEMVDALEDSKADFEGQLWTFNRTDEGSWKDPVLITYKNQANNTLERGSKEMHVEQMAYNRLVKFQELTKGTNPDSLVSMIARDIVESPEGAKVSGIGGLADDMVTGTGQSIGAEVGALLPKSHMVRDNEANIAALRLADRSDALAINVTQKDVASLGDLPLRLNASVNKKSQVLYNAFSSFRNGFELQINGAFQDPATGFWQFKLKPDSMINKRRMEELGLPYVNGSVLPNHLTKAPLVLDDLGMKFLDKITGIFEAKRVEKNKLRVAMGLPEVGKQAYWLPSESTKGKFVAFVIDKQTKQVVPGKTIISDNAKTFQDRLRQAREPGFLKNGEYLHTQHEIEHTQDIYDQAQMHFVDASFAGAKGVSNKGGLTGNVVRNDTVGEQLRYLESQNTHLARSTIRVMLEDQIQIAKMRRTVVKNAYGQQSNFIVSALKGSNKGHEAHTIWDDYLTALVGQGMADSTPRSLTTLLDSTEKYLQVVTTGAWTGINSLPPKQIMNWVGDLANRLGTNVKTTAKTFDQLTQELGPHMPYATMEKFVEQTIKGGSPPEVRAIAQTMNRWDATWRLRYFELPNAAMNMLGIIDNMPAVIGADANILGYIGAKNGKKLGVIDSMGILMKGTKSWMSKTYQKDMDYAQRLGALEPGFAEIRTMHAGIEDRSSWKKYMFGDKSLPSNATPFSPDWIRRKGLDGMMALGNDTTESWSRSWAHAIGLQLADQRGLTDMHERFTFANRIADEAIANYSPRNRGEIYQTALGSMMGLYQTYAMNYASRMYRYVEGGDYQAIMRQVGMQSMMFGVKSNIGWNQLEWLEDSATGDEATISDMIYAKFGPAVGSMIAHGGVADIYRLFGADTGVALYQRADSNIRSNVVAEGVLADPFKLAPALGTAKSMATGMLEIGSALWQDGRMTTGRQISETLATHMPNRMLRGAITVRLNDGNDVDNYGQIASTSKGIFESSLRVMGLRSTRQQDELDFKFANRSSLDRQAAKMEGLRKDTRAILRAGQGDRIGEVFNRYVELGLAPQLFSSWIRQQVESASSTRQLKEMKQGLNSPRTQAQLARWGWVERE